MNQIVATARTWLGTNYQHQHRTKHVGVDCAGLIIGVARELGIVAPDFDVNGYDRTPDGVSLLAECDRFMARVDPWNKQPGHVIVLRFEQDPQHIGILGDYRHGGLSLIHARGTTDGKGSVIEHRLSAEMLSKAVQVYEMPEAKWLA